MTQYFALHSRPTSGPSGSSRRSEPALRPDLAPEHSDAGYAVDSTDLLRGQKAVQITHNGLIYRLQATRLGKLILTK